jgi:hypothetical protein
MLLSLTVFHTGKAPPSREPTQRFTNRTLLHRMLSTLYLLASSFGWVKRVGLQVISLQKVSDRAGGQPNGSAIPSTPNLQSYWSSTGCWLWNNNINFWWYAPFDAPGDSRGGVEQHFGCKVPRKSSNIQVATSDQALKIDLRC